MPFTHFEGRRDGVVVNRGTCDPTLCMKMRHIIVVEWVKRIWNASGVYKKWEEVRFIEPKILANVSSFFFWLGNVPEVLAIMWRWKYRCKWSTKCPKAKQKKISDLCLHAWKHEESLHPPEAICQLRVGHATSLLNSALCNRRTSKIYLLTPAFIPKLKFDNRISHAFNRPN